MPRGGPVFRSEVVQRPATKALTAAAQNYSVGAMSRTISRAGGRRQESKEWMSVLWRLYDIIPEFRYAVDWVGNLLSKGKLTVLENGQPTTNQAALDALASLFGGPDGQREMLRLFGIHFTLAGEAWLIGEPESRDEDRWGLYAATEITRQTTRSDGTIDGVQIDGEEVDDMALIVRLWRPHPARVTAPNSPARACIPILEEIETLTEHVAAIAKSRLASAGILLVPQEMELPQISVTSGNPGEEQVVQIASGADGLTQRLIDIASTAIRERSSAAALVPLVITAPGEFIEKIQHLTFWSGLDEHQKDLREEALTRLARGMDMPPEVLTGTGDMNHWGAWQMDEAGVKSHTEPLIKIIVHSLTTGYLRPYLESQDVEDVQAFEFGVDTAEMRARPNRSKEALELYDRGAISAETLRRETGFTEDDVMTEQEKVMWFIEKVASGQTMPEDVRNALRLIGVKMPEVTDGTQSEEVVHEARPIRSLREHPDRGAPDPDQSEAQGAPQERTTPSRAAATPDALVMAAEQMVWRALERAGNRLKHRLPGRRSEHDAPDIYLHMEVPAQVAADALQDAWRMDRFSYPGVSNNLLQTVLTRHCTKLLTTSTPYSRDALTRDLSLLIRNVA